MNLRRVPVRRAVTVLLVTAGLGTTAAITAAYLRGTSIPLLEPKGPIAAEEEQLILVAAALSLFVLVPVFALAITFAIRYREGNTDAKYSPTLTNSPRIEAAWWILPSALIGILAVIGWSSAYTLDPFQPLTSATKPLAIEVVALDWKWLFIYPAQHIACVNEMVIPETTPINLSLTSDAPMNSFWIPQLSGQIYAMPGMQTQLHLEASSSGTFNGTTANLSGVGFSGMRFQTKSTPSQDFQQWVLRTERSPTSLSLTQYQALARPTTNDPVSCYSNADPSLFASIIARYMAPTGGHGMRPTP
ncbi:MAG: ubiquinol oxidase subunit II [Actinomycetota bacterium]|nr:ubiquinol oxidase subunit II [Actinomycetota bacterium]